VRIAVSGTHGSGKSTLVEDFVARHRHYVHEPEPYEWLDGCGEAAADELTVDAAWRQLEVSVERLRSYARGAKVIAERSPLDFIAYLLALEDLGRAGGDPQMVSSAAALAASGMACIDLVVILPLDDGIAVPECEDPALRTAMNERLLDLVAADPYALFTGGTPRVVEIEGARAQRLRVLEALVRG
jgi:hypothetical protein